MSLFHFSSLNYELAQSTPSGSLNILWNQLNQKTIANSIMYMTPTFNFSIGYEYPEFGLYGNNLLNPMLAVQQTMQAFQNGSWMNGMNNFFNNWQMPWNNPWGGSSDGSTSGSNSEYNTLRDLIKKYKDYYFKQGNLSTTLMDKIDAALNKTGTQEEKLEALREIYKKLNKDKLQAVLLDFPEYKEMLSAAGYRFNGTNKEEDAKLGKDINGLYRSITTTNKSTKFDKLIELFPGEDNPYILRIVSYWNDKYNESGNRGIIRLIANNLPEEESELKKPQEGVKNIAMALINKVEDFKTSTDGDFAKLDDAKEAVSDALTDVDKDFTKENLMKLADKFDTLYAMLRMMEAEKIRNTINTKYGFLNDISSTDKDIVTDELIVKETEADLKKEGIEVIPEVDNIPPEDEEEISDIDERVDTVEEKVEALVEEKELKKTDKEGVYTTATVSQDELPKFYTIRNDKLVELKAVKSIDKDGNCTMVDGTVKALKDVEANEVSAQDVVDYNNTLERIASLKKDGRLVKCSTTLGDTTLYRCRGKQENGQYQYFVVRNNKLMRIICDNVLANGTIMINGQSKTLAELTDSDFEEISNSDILASDMKAESENRRVQDAKNKKDAEDKKLQDILDKKFVKNEVQEGVDIGKKIVDALEWYTTDDEWGSAVDNIDLIDADNVYSVIQGYKEDKNWGADDIIRQIRTESGRNAEEKMRLIIHIVDAVIGYCEKYGTSSKEGFTELLKIQETLKPDTLISTETAENIDRYILRIFNL